LVLMQEILEWLEHSQEAEVEVEVQEVEQE
jgi:hypothetical protein